MLTQNASRRDRTNRARQPGNHPPISVHMRPLRTGREFGRSATDIDISRDLRRVSRSFRWSKWPMTRLCAITATSGLQHWTHGGRTGCDPLSGKSGGARAACSPSRFYATVSPRPESAVLSLCGSPEPTTQGVESSALDDRARSPNM
jgi:hypothetical protein